MITLRCCVIDDEPLAARLIGSYVERTPFLSLEGVYNSATDAARPIISGEIDLVFLDIEMPQLGGMEFAKIIPETCKVVFTTAYDRYAVQGFRVNALDYLLKPVVPEELQAAVERCRKALLSENPAPAPDAALLRSLLAGSGREYRKRFVVRLGDKITVVNTEQIAYFYAEDKYTYLVTADGRRLILDTSLDAVADQLDPRLFFRLSRNCTAAIASIAGISRHSSNRLKVSLEPRPDFEVFVSRSRTADFMNWLEDKQA